MRHASGISVRLLPTLGALLLLAGSGCVTLKRVPLKDEDRDQVASVRTVAAFHQQEIGISIQRSNLGGFFGIIGAVIDAAEDSSANKAAQTVVVPVRDALLDYDPQKVLQTALRKELAPLKWLKGNSVEAKMLGDNKAIEDLVRKGDVEEVLLIRTDYRFTPKFDALVVTAHVSLVPRTSKDPNRVVDGSIPNEPLLPPAFYTNVFVSSGSLSARMNEKTKPEEMVALWAENKGVRSRTVLDDSFAEIARMIAFDLEQSAGAKPAAPAEAKAAQAFTPFGGPLGPGLVVREVSGKTWVRLEGNGFLSSNGELKL